MDSFRLNLEADKLIPIDLDHVVHAANNRVRSLSKFIRSLELCAAVFLLIWLSIRLPFAFKLLGEFLRRVAGVIVSPLFVFGLSNVIIATLFVKSFRLSAEIVAKDNVGTQFYEEVVKPIEVCGKPLFEEVEVQDGDHLIMPLSEEVVYEDKEIVFEESSSVPTYETADEEETETDTLSAMDNPRVYRRGLSEKLPGSEKEVEMEVLEFQQSKKEILNNKAFCEDMLENLCPEDEMSSEEFKKTIDAFIEKQLKFRRRESLAIFMKNRSSIALAN